MKIAFLFSGQLRKISPILFKYSLSNLVKDLDYDIYAYLWKESGKSLNHSKSNPKIINSENALSNLDDLLNGFNIGEIKGESYFDFKNNIDQKYKRIIDSKQYHFGTINSLSQIYTISKCFKLLNNNYNNYDLIFRCRFDSLFVHPLKLYDLNKFGNENTIYSINFGRAYNYSRIYDIFFGGSKKAMMFLDDIWENIPELVNNEFDNKLDKRDSCRLIYLAAINYGNKVASFDTRICDVYRGFKDNFYEKYLIKSHLISLRKFFINFKYLNYFFKWFFFRKYKIRSSLFAILKAIVLLPISLIKRINLL